MTSDQREAFTLEGGVRILAQGKFFLHIPTSNHLISKQNSCVSISTLNRSGHNHYLTRLRYHSFISLPIAL